MKEDKISISISEAIKVREMWNMWFEEIEVRGSHKSHGSFLSQYPPPFLSNMHPKFCIFWWWCLWWGSIHCSAQGRTRRGMYHGYHTCNDDGELNMMMMVMFISTVLPIQGGTRRGMMMGFASFPVSSSRHKRAVFFTATFLFSADA